MVDAGAGADDDLQSREEIESLGRDRGRADGEKSSYGGGVAGEE